MTQISAAQARDAFVQTTRGTHTAQQDTFNARVAARIARDMQMAKPATNKTHRGA